MYVYTHTYAWSVSRLGHELNHELAPYWCLPPHNGSRHAHQYPKPNFHMKYLTLFFVLNTLLPMPCTSNKPFFSFFTLIRYQTVLIYNSKYQTLFFISFCFTFLSSIPDSLCPAPRTSLFATHLFATLWAASRWWAGPLGVLTARPVYIYIYTHTHTYIRTYIIRPNIWNGWIHPIRPIYTEWADSPPIWGIFIVNLL